MSFVNVAPQLVSTAAADAARIGSSRTARSSSTTRIRTDTSVVAAPETGLRGAPWYAGLFDEV
ncbi:PE-PGRS family protein [Mycobacterium tuberculosis]|nr:PE-PGRS family protein [Mycobacterium tuberculosis]